MSKTKKNNDLTYEDKNNSIIIISCLSCLKHNLIFYVPQNKAGKVSTHCYLNHKKNVSNVLSFDNNSNI